MTGLGQCCYGKAYLLPKAFSYKYRPILDKIKMELQCFTEELDSACKTNQVMSTSLAHSCAHSFVPLETISVTCSCSQFSKSGTLVNTCTYMYDTLQST